MSQNAIHYFRAFDIERGTGQPGYRWVQGYLAIQPDTLHELHPAVTRREAQAEAKAEGRKAIFHDTKEAALAAIRA